MQQYADYIEQIEIESLWGGRKHILWNLDKKVNILSGINGVGKSTILNRAVKTTTFFATLQRGQSADATAAAGFAQPAVSAAGGGVSAGGVTIRLSPATATRVRYDIIRSFDRPLLGRELVNKIIDETVTTELDWQLYQLQRKYLDYQVNVGNRIIGVLQTAGADTAALAARISAPKTRFQDMVDRLFAETGKKLIRTKNELAFIQIGEELSPYQLSSGEKQMLIILLTVLIEDGLPYVLFMDEPETSLHIDWQQRLIDNILQLNPNVQIILTTHSPAVVMNGWVDKVTEVSDITIDK